MKPPKFDQFQYVKIRGKGVYGKIVSTAGWAIHSHHRQNLLDDSLRPFWGALYDCDVSNAPRSYIVRIDKNDLPKIGDYYKLYAPPHKYYDPQKTSIRVSEDLLMGLDPLETLVFTN